MHTHTNTQLSSIWIFFLNIIQDVLSWLNVRRLHQGYLTEWVTEKEAVTENEKQSTRWEGVATASFSAESSGIACIFIRLISIWASRKEWWCKKKTNKKTKKKTNTHTHTAELLNMQAVQCWWSCEKDGCLTWSSIQSRRCQGRQRGSENTSEEKN